MTSTPGIGKVHLSQDQLNTMAQRCEDTSSSLARGMAQLISRIEGLSGSGFAGGANSALQNVSADLNSGLTKIMNALDELAGKMSAASTNFGVQDDDAASTIRAAAADVGGSSVMSTLRGA